MKNFGKKINRKYLTVFILGIMMAMFITTFSVSIANGHSFKEALGLGGGAVTLCSMSIIGNIKRVTDTHSTGGQIWARIYLATIDQLDEKFAFPMENASGEVGQVHLLDGEFFHYFEAVHNTPDDKSALAKGDITSATTNTFGFTVAGDLAKIRKFCKEHAGDSFIIIYYIIESKEWRILGTKWKPMVLQSADRSNNKDSRSCAMTFQNIDLQQSSIYTGTIPEQDATVLAADATTIPFTSAQNQYKTNSANSAATVITLFSGLTSSDEGRIVEIIGGGGTNPSTIAETSGFILKSGETWTGAAGKSIRFRVLDASTLVEVDRTA